MFYEAFTYERFFTEVTTEEDAQRLIWHAKFDGKDFVCPHCQNETFNSIKTRPIVRTCKACRKQTR